MRFDVRALRVCGCVAREVGVKWELSEERWKIYGDMMVIFVDVRGLGEFEYGLF